MLAELLQLPQLTFATALEVEDGQVSAHRQTADGHQVVEASMPAVCSVTAGIAEPRYASLRGIMAARSKEVRELSLADLGVERRQPAEEVLAIDDAEARTAGEIVEDDGTTGVDRIVEVLVRAKVI
jgi:electron transfer flavoprotein beta subunit